MPIDPDMLFRSISFDPRLQPFETKERDAELRDAGYQGEIRPDQSYQGMLGLLEMKKEWGLTPETSGRANCRCTGGEDAEEPHRLSMIRVTNVRRSRSRSSGGNVLRFMLIGREGRNNIVTFSDRFGVRCGVFGVAEQPVLTAEA